MITLILQAWTTRKNANLFQDLPTNRISTSIRPKGTGGHKKTELLRHETGDEVGAVINFRFTVANGIRAVTRGEINMAFKPGVARKVLKRLEEMAIRFILRNPAKALWEIENV